jgi:hypothetical protein
VALAVVLVDKVGVMLGDWVPEELAVAVLDTEAALEIVAEPEVVAAAVAEAAPE